MSNGPLSRSEYKKLLCDGQLAGVSARIDVTILKANAEGNGCPFTDDELDRMIKATESCYDVLRGCLRSARSREGQ